MDAKGLLIVISGPSGAGKGTIYNSVIERRPEIKKSISVTTRAPRKGEVDGVHYHFKTLLEYQHMIAKDEFLETASVFENHYGTPKAPIMKMLHNGDDVMFEIDVHGARQIKAKYPQSVSIFIMPPSFDILEQRLRGRATDSEESINLRINGAARELGCYEEFDYIVFNDDLEKAINQVLAIIDAEKCRICNNMNAIKTILASKSKKSSSNKRR